MQQSSGDCWDSIMRRPSKWAGLGEARRLRRSLRRGRDLFVVGRKARVWGLAAWRNVYAGRCDGRRETWMAEAPRHACVECLAARRLAANLTPATRPLSTSAKQSNRAVYQLLAILL